MVSAGKKAKAIWAWKAFGYEALGHDGLCAKARIQFKGAL